MAIIRTDGPSKAIPTSVPVEPQITETKRKEVGPAVKATPAQIAADARKLDSLKVGEGKTKLEGVQEKGVAQTDLGALLKDIQSIDIGGKPNIAVPPSYTIVVATAPPVAPMVLSGSDHTVLQSLADQINKGTLKLPPELASAIIELSKLSAAQLEAMMKEGPPPNDAALLSLQKALKDANLDLKTLLQPSRTSLTPKALDETMGALRKLFPNVSDRVLRQLAQLSKPALTLLASSYRTNLSATKPASSTRPTTTASSTTAPTDVLEDDDDLLSLIDSMPITLPRHDETAQNALDGLIGRMMSSGDANIEMLVQLVLMQIAGGQRDEVKEQLEEMQKTQKMKDAQREFITSMKKQAAEARTLARSEYDHRTGLPIDDPLYIDRESVSFEDFLDRRMLATEGSFDSPNGDGTPPSLPDVSLSPNQPLFPVTLTDLRGRTFTFDDAAMSEKLSITVEELLDLRAAYNAAPEVRAEFKSFEEWLVGSTSKGGAGLVSPASESQSVAVADALAAAAAFASPATTQPGAPATVAPTTPTTADMASIRAAADKYALPLTEILRAYDAFKQAKSTGSFEKFLSDTVGLETQSDLDKRMEPMHLLAIQQAATKFPPNMTFINEYKKFDDWKAEFGLDLKTENQAALKSYFSIATGGVAGGGDPRKMSSDAYDIKAGLDNESYNGENDQRNKLSENQRESDAAIKAWAQSVGIDPKHINELDDLLVDLMVATLATDALAGRLSDDKKKEGFVAPKNPQDIFNELVAKCKTLGGNDLNMSKALAEYCTLRVTEFRRDLEQAKEDDAWGGAAEFGSKFILDNSGDIDVDGFGVKKEDGGVFLSDQKMDYHLHLTWDWGDGGDHGNLKTEDYARASDRMSEMFTSTGTSVDGAPGSSQAGTKVDVRMFLNEVLKDMVTSGTKTPEQSAMAAIRDKNYTNDPRLTNETSGSARGIGIGTRGRDLLNLGSIDNLGSIGALGLRGVVAGGALRPGSGTSSSSTLSAAQQASLDSLREPREGKEPPGEVSGLRQMTLAQYEAVIEEWQGKSDSTSAVSEQLTLKLQMMMDRLQQAQSMLSNMMKKISDTSSGIIGNMK